MVRGVRSTQKVSAATWRSRLKRFYPLYIMFIPVAVYYLVFHYAPMAGMVIAFKKYTFRSGIFGSPWVGLANFIEFFRNGDFWIVFSNTFSISLMRIAFGFPMPILFALLLNEVRLPKFKKFIQTVSYLPHFISWVVLYGILFSFFSSSGMINQILTKIGIGSVPFLSSERYFRVFFVASAIWKELGWSAIIYLAALTSVDQEMYEAAMIDGANRWQQLLRITLPAIGSVISVMLVLNFTNVLSVGFEQVLVMYNSAVSGVADVIDYYVYRQGLETMNYSYATAVGFFKSVLSLFFVLTANFLARKIDPDGGLW